MLTKVYTQFGVENILVEAVEGVFVIDAHNRYARPTNPFLSHNIGGGIIFSTRWGCLIVDEVQNHTNIRTKKCRAIGSICANHRWALSGTMFNEPNPKRVLGYYIILDLPSPRNLPEMKELLKSRRFPGLDSTMVRRETNPDFVPPEVKCTIINHTLSKEEQIVYTTMKKIMAALAIKAKELKEAGDVTGARKFRSYVLALITYLRQSLVCPLIPISSAAADIADYENKSELSKILMEQINQCGLNEWLNDPRAACSTRIQEIIRVIQQHPNERIVIFSCFRSCLNVLNHHLGDYNLFEITSKMNIEQRSAVINNFSQSSDGILSLTYQIGSEGLNLQCSATVVLTDLWWNAGTTKQSIARLLRFGQKAKIINIYMFTSNTGIEKALFEKHRAKSIILEELRTGPTSRKVPKMKMAEIVKIITEDEAVNKTLLREINELTL